MKLIAFPPTDIVADELFDNSCPQPGKEPAGIDDVITALTALYQVQARLWAIPDKAEVLPGVSVTVSRTPVSSLLVSCPSDVTPLEIASVVCAARAAGVAKIGVSSCGIAAVESIKARLGVDDITGHAERTLTIGKQIPRCGVAAIVADSLSETATVANVARRLEDEGNRVVIYTTSKRIASQLPAAMPESCVTVLLMRAEGEIDRSLQVLQPSLIVALCENARKVAAQVDFATNVVLGPLPAEGAAGSLAAMNMPLVPIHLLTRSTAVIDPLTAR